MHTGTRHNISIHNVDAPLSLLQGTLAIHENFPRQQKVVVKRITTENKSRSQCIFGGGVPDNKQVQACGMKQNDKHCLLYCIHWMYLDAISAKLMTEGSLQLKGSLTPAIVLCTPSVQLRQLQPKKL